MILDGYILFIWQDVILSDYVVVITDVYNKSLRFVFNHFHGVEWPLCADGAIRKLLIHWLLFTPILRMLSLWMILLGLISCWFTDGRMMCFTTNCDITIWWQVKTKYG